MQYAHVCMDMQLFAVASLIKWTNKEKWQNLIIHPGMMHTLMSFLGCIGTLMKGSGMETLLSSTFGCMTSILTGKSWPQALRAYRMLTGVLLAEFMESGQKTYDEIEEYIDSVRHHATGRLWVDCLIKPVMIANFFIHAEHKGDFLHCDYQIN